MKIGHSSVCLLTPKKEYLGRWYDSDISSSDDKIDEQQIQNEFEKQASAEYLFSKATTNNSITSLATK